MLQHRWNNDGSLTILRANDDNVTLTAAEVLGLPHVIVNRPLINTEVAEPDENKVAGKPETTSKIAGKGTSKGLGI